MAKIVKITAQLATEFNKLAKEYDINKEAIERAEKLEQLQESKDENLLKYTLAYSIEKPLDIDRAAKLSEFYQKAFKLINDKDATDLEEAEQEVEKFRKRSKLII